MSRLIIPRQLIAQLESHARAELPDECCGMLGGNAPRVTSQHPLRNLSTTPANSYFASPEDIFKAMRRMRDAHQDLLAIYHSHPRGQPSPSPTDIELAYYPQVAYVILALTPEFEARGFTIRGQAVEAVEIIIENNECMPWQDTQP